MPPYGNNSDVVRNLLDQRASKTSSVSISDRPDTPSVYTQFSPRSTYFPEPDSPLPPLPPYLHQSSHYTRRDSSDDDPPEEDYTDLEEDGDTQVLTLNHSRSHHVSLDPAHESPEIVRKLSLLGPKMKIHSVAPWEMDGAGGDADDYDDDARSIDSRSIFRGKRKHKSKDRSENLFKGISLGNVSPRFMRAGRPSHDSFHSNDDPPPLPRTSRKAVASTTSLNSLPPTSSRLSPGTTTPPEPCSPLPAAESLPPAFETAPINEDRTTARVGKALQREGHGIGAANSKGQSFSSSGESQNRAVAVNDAKGLKFPSGDIAKTNNTPSYVEHQQAGNRHPEADMAGWGEVPGVPTNNLITLEEAFSRSQRSRTRAKSFGTPTESYPTSQPSFTTGRTDFTSHLTAFEYATHPREVSEPYVAQQPVTVKHKRSGILRIFNKEREGERKRAITSVDIPPAVPPLPTGKDSGSSLSKQVLEHPVARTPKRIPVPTIEHQNSPAKPPLPLLSIPSSPTRGESSATKIAAGRSPSEQKAQRKAGASAKMATRCSDKAAPFPTLSLRPVSSLFSEHFNDHILPSAPSSATTSDPFSSRSSSTSTTLSTPLTSPLPITPTFRNGNGFLPVLPQCSENDTPTESGSATFKEQLGIAKTSWQTQVWNLERQVRELKEEVSRLRGGETCDACGRGGGKLEGGILNRPRGTGGSRTLFGGTRE